jgi:hypothetical protein
MMMMVECEARARVARPARRVAGLGAGAYAKLHWQVEAGVTVTVPTAPGRISCQWRVSLGGSEPASGGCQQEPGQGPGRMPELPHATRKSPGPAARA